MIVEPFVEILMATYQGEKWLDVQIATIFAQDYTNWRLIIRDDCSTDGTRNIIRFWRDRSPDKIVFIDDDRSENLGMIENFSALMEASTSNYVMFSDQDDVWHQNKISNAVAAMQALEKHHGVQRPLLVHTDAYVVDKNLQLICRSATRHQGIRPSRKHQVGNFILENHAQGCTMIVNRALILKSLPIPQEGLHVDWWLALVASEFGIVEALREPSMAWRRHDTNASALPSIANTLRSARNPLRLRRAFYQKLEVNQAIIQSFLTRFYDRLPPRDISAIEAFLALPTLGFWGRRIAVLRHRLFFSSWLRIAGLLVLV